MPNESLTLPRLRHVVIVADESADWKIAGMRQIDRLALTLDDFAERHDIERIDVSVQWKNAYRAALPNESRLQRVGFVDHDERSADLTLPTRLFLHRGGIEDLIAAAPDSESNANDRPWQLLSDPKQIPACERRLLRGYGKSQDGIVSRYLNRPISRCVSRLLLKLPITPSAWSLFIFILPITACCAFVARSYTGFVVGAAIFQLYSILDGCDGEIARAKFMQTEFGRRLDSLCDLLGNVLLALSMGIGLARQHSEWFYLFEGIATAVLILTSEGIVFVRRTRGEASNPAPLRWNGVLYQRHHEFVERSGILLLGEEVARWLLVLTKRDMAMFAFFILALVGLPGLSLLLLLIVSGASTALASNAFLRPAAPAFPQEAS